MWNVKESLSILRMFYVYLVVIVNKESIWLDEFKGCFLILNKYLELNC